MTKAETKTLLQLLEEVPDHRVGNAIRYSLRDILFLGIFAILCGAETYTGMQVFSELHLEELRQYLELPHGVPSHDVFGDVFKRQRCAWSFHYALAVVKLGFFVSDCPV